MCQGCTLALATDAPNMCLCAAEPLKELFVIFLFPLISVLLWKLVHKTLGFVLMFRLRWSIFQLSPVFAGVFASTRVFPLTLYAPEPLLKFAPHSVWTSNILRDVDSGLKDGSHSLEWKFALQARNQKMFSSFQVCPLLIRVSPTGPRDFTS